MPILEINYFPRENKKGERVWYSECIQIPEIMAWGNTKREALVGLANKLKAVKKQRIEELK